MKEGILLIEMWANRLGNTILELVEKLRLPYEVRKPYAGENIPCEPYKGVIISPGVPDICEIEKYPFLKQVISFTQYAIEKDVPILGICLGHQILACAVGGKVCRANELEVGFIKISHNSRWIFDMVDNPVTVFQYHFNEVVRLPENTEILAENKNCKTQAFKIKDKPCFGVQFHPEIGLQKGIGILMKRKEFLELRRMDVAEAINSGQKTYNENQARCVMINYLNRVVMKNSGNVKIKT